MSEQLRSLFQELWASSFETQDEQEAQILKFAYTKIAIFACI